jgi:flagellar basal body-associated protein FliL
LIIIIIVMVVVVVLIAVIVIVIIILYRKKMNRNLRNVTDSSGTKESEMESLRASGLSSSTGQKTQRKISLCTSFYFTYSFFV